MDKYVTYLDFGVTRIENQEFDLFPFLDPIFHHSRTPTLLIYTPGPRGLDHNVYITEVQPCSRRYFL